MKVNQTAIGNPGSMLVKLSGWAFILGSISFASIFSDSDLLLLPGSLISAILLAIGLAGLRARYGEQIGGFGRFILRAGVIGTVLYFLGLAAGSIIGLATGSSAKAYFGANDIWILLFAGPAVGLLALTLFGLVALSTKPMPRLNWLPVLAGIWYPAVYIFGAVSVYTHNGEYLGQYDSAIQILLVIQFLALCVFGAAVMVQRPQEVAAA